MSSRALLGVVVGLTSMAAPAAAGPTPVATYDFASGTLKAHESNAPQLVAINPLGKNAFANDTVLGEKKTVYRFAGNARPLTEQAGLQLDTTGLLKSNAYSINLVVSFDAKGPTWTRILDASNRQDDKGLYVEPGGKLQVYPVGNGPHNWTFGAYHRVTLTNSGNGVVTAYYDGSFEFDLKTTVMDFSAYAGNPKHLLMFFVDNVVGGGQGEFMSGKVSLIRIYDTTLEAKVVKTLEIASSPKPDIAVPPLDSTMGPAATWKGGKWKEVGWGGCDGAEVWSEAGKDKLPSVDRCTPANAGKVVVCNAATGCSYKSLTRDQCQNGKAPGVVSVCTEK